MSIAAVPSTMQKWNTVGVPKALTASSLPLRCASAIRAVTTNCRPVNAAPDDPTMT